MAFYLGRTCLLPAKGSPLLPFPADAAAAAAKQKMHLGNVSNSLGGIFGLTLHNFHDQIQTSPLKLFRKFICFAKGRLP